MRNLPPLIQLRAFEASARHLSFKQAADELCVSPSAVSHQIKMLEDFCRCQLFRRRPRPIALTRSGELLFQVVKNGLDEFASIMTSIQGNQAPVNLRLTTTSLFAAKWLAPRLSDLRNVFPALSLDVIATDLVVDLQDEADLAIRYMNAPYGTSEITSRELVRDNFIVVCHPRLLRGGEKFNSLTELSRCTLVHTHWYPEDLTAPTWERWSELAAKHYDESVSFQKLHYLQFHEDTQAIDAVLNGAGLLIVSDFLVAHELEEGDLVKAIDFSLPGYGFYLCYRKDHPHRAIFESFEHWARNIIDVPRQD
jgi:LysR family glycine cleavage system transcriptional activator